MHICFLNRHLNLCLESDILYYTFSGLDRNIIFGNLIYI